MKLADQNKYIVVQKMNLEKMTKTLNKCLFECSKN